MEFIPFPKLGRWSRDIIITEKIDGTNASIFIGENGEFLTGSRNRWITPEDDNFGFSKWAHENKEELMKLGPGTHFGEWYGQGIQRNYAMKEKRFALFNVTRWLENRPNCCEIVPILYKGPMDESKIIEAMEHLQKYGSKIESGFGFPKPEGIVIFCTSNQVGFKKTFEKDAEGKGTK